MQHGGQDLPHKIGAEREKDRRQSAEQLELALQGADLGLWDWDLRGDRFEHNQVTRQQLGYAGEFAWRQVRRGVRAGQVRFGSWIKQVGA